MREVAGGWQVKAGWDAAEGTNPPLDHTTSSGDGEKPMGDSWLFGRWKMKSGKWREMWIGSGAT